MDDTSTDPLTTSGSDMVTSEAEPPQVAVPPVVPADGSSPADEEHGSLSSEMQAPLVQLEVERARWKAIADSSEDAIVWKDLDGIITSWNRGAEVLYGYVAEEVVGRSIDLIIPPELPDELPRILGKLERGERIQRFETIRVRKGGSRVQVAVTVTPIKDADGRVIGAISIARDITARKRAEKTQRFLSEATNLLSRSLDYDRTLEAIAGLAIPHLADICVVDMIDSDTVRQRATAQGGATYNECLRQLQATYSLDSETSHPVWEVLRTGEPWVMGNTSVPTSLAPRASTDFFAVLKKSGVESCLVVPLMIRGRAAGTVSFISLDVDRRYSEEDLVVAQEFAVRAAAAIDNARLYRDAREAVKARDEFLSVAAHELKTPMTSLRGFVQLATRQLDRDGTLDPAQVRQALGVIDQQSRKLSNLISQLLDVSRLEAGRLALERQLVDLGKLVEGVVAATLVGSADHAVVVHIPSPMLVLADPLRLEQVVTNLLDNAVKYSPVGSLIEVELLQPSRDVVRCTIRDHGPGIPPEFRDRIFTRFNQAQASQAGGMGLGLYISHEIVVLHGGRIVAEFPDDGGTRFVVTLPRGLSDGDAGKWAA